MNQFSLAGYGFVQFFAGTSEQTADDLSRSGNDADVTALFDDVSQHTLKVEMIHAKPGVPVVLPISTAPKCITKVRFAGKMPAVVPENDPHGNAQLMLRKGSAVEVVYYSLEHPEGNVKYFSM